MRLCTLINQTIAEFDDVYGIEGVDVTCQPDDTPLVDINLENYLSSFTSLHQRKKNLMRSVDGWRKEIVDDLVNLEELLPETKNSINYLKIAGAVSMVGGLITSGIAISKGAPITNGWGYFVGVGALVFGSQSKRPLYSMARKKMVKKIQQRKEELSKFEEDKHPIVEYNKKGFRKIARIQIVMDELSERPLGDYSKRRLTEIESAAVAYIQDTTTKSDFLTSFTKTRPKPLDLSAQLEDPPIAGDMQAPQQKRLYDELTYLLCREIGLDKETSTYLASKVDYDTADDTHTKITAALNGQADDFFSQNSQVLTLSNGSKSNYMELFFGLIGKYGEEALSPSNMHFYGSAYGLSRLERKLSPDISQEIEEESALDLSSEGYENMELLRAMLSKGFGLGTSSPKIMMSYLVIQSIRDDSIHGDGTLSKQFNLYMKQLIADGAVWTAKTNKAPDCCFSINPHLDEIKKSGLRQLIGDMLYG